MTVLTKISVDSLKPRADRFEVPDGRVRGLYIVVQPSGAKSWAARYRHHGRARKLTLGPFPTLGLEQARKLAGDAMSNVAAGRDPAGEKVKAREAARSDQLFGVLYDRYFNEHVAQTFKPSSIRLCKDIFGRLILPKLKRIRLSEVTAQDCKACWRAPVRKGHRTTANKVHKHLRQFFNWLNAELITQINPMEKIRKPAEDKSRDRKLTDQEIIWFWCACEEIGYPFGPAFQLLLLTGGRRGEVQGMTDREIDWPGDVWLIPGARTKNGIEHTVYMSDLMQQILSALPVIGRGKNWRYLFTTSGTKPASGFANGKARLDRIMKRLAGDVPIPPWVVHDLRRSFASGCSRLTPRVPLEVVERCLNHVSGSYGGIVGVYQLEHLAPEKKEAFQRWADHVKSLVSEH